MNNVSSHSYSIRSNGSDCMLDTTTLEKDLGVYIDSDLTFEAHIREVVNKANRVTGVIKRNFKDLSCSAFVLLYKAMVRSHLEYAQNVWSPYKRKYIDMIEKVQRRATKIIPTIAKMPYKSRLKN